MDLKYYYQRYRAVLSDIEGPYVVIVSLATPDGGKAGVYTEVTRDNGARAVVEGRGRLATQSEEAEFREVVKIQIEAAAAEAAEAYAVSLGVKPLQPKK